MSKNMVNTILFLDVDESMVNLYIPKINEHNQKMNQTHPDSGFDLYTPFQLQYDKGTHKVDFMVKGAMYKSPTPINVNNVDISSYTPTGYYLYPRSSIVKTSFRLANCTGIIDSGYRGNIGAYFDCIQSENIEYGQRLVQICAPSLEPFYIVLSTNLSNTIRGANGFGSSGL